MVVRQKLLSLLSVIFLSVLLAGCSETKLISHYAKKLPWPSEENPASKGNYKIGKPYRVGAVSYYPQESFHLVETGIASWYGPNFHGKRTANGEIFDKNELTAAHRTLQMPSFVRVTNLENGRSVVVRINDRGPFLHGRVIDVSRRAAELLGFIGKGTARVRVEVLEKESRQIAEAARRGLNTSRMTVSELDKMNVPTIEETPETRAAQTKVAYQQNDAQTLPESLQTPTITVEELSSSGRRSAPMRPVYDRREPLPVHMNKDGRYMPDAVVRTEPVVPTGLYIQAGAFAVKSNADRLVGTLGSIAPTRIESVTVSGRTLYRVKLGPFSTVEAADNALARVIRLGQGGAKVIKK